MKRHEALPSKYIKTEELNGRTVDLVIDRVVGEMIKSNEGPDEHKAVVYFVGKDRGMILNATNWDTLESVYGGESDDWAGKEMQLFPTTTRFGSKTVPCMRIQFANSAPPAPAAAPAEDEIPF